MYNISKTTGEALATTILDILKRFGLPLEKLREQCYYGAANMAGDIKGVKARILQVQPAALYVHCFAHSLNLAVQDSVRSVTFIRDGLQFLHDLATVVRSSAKRLGTFREIAAGVEGFNPATPKPLCATR